MTREQRRRLRADQAALAAEYDREARDLMRRLEEGFCPGVVGAMPGGARRPAGIIRRPGSGALSRCFFRKLRPIRCFFGKYQPARCFLGDLTPAGAMCYDAYRRITNQPRRAMDYDNNGRSLSARDEFQPRGNEEGAPTATTPERPYAAYVRANFRQTYRSFERQEQAEEYGTDLIRKGQKEVIITKLVGVLRPRVDIEKVTVS